jgi:hypothetical protein
MKLSPAFRNASIETICLLYILLFVYAAVSKILDFETFQIQLGQSPVLGTFALELSYLVPSLELVISIFLIFKSFRFIGLTAAFSLMIMFTVYIVIILNWSFFIPCSCGGILENMGWNEHLIFNCIYIILAVAGIFLIYCEIKEAKYNQGFFYYLVSRGFKFGGTLVLVLIMSILLVIGLYLISEDSIQRNNAFLRRYPPHPAKFIEAQYLKFDSYYIAGASSGKIYLGNSTAPLHALAIDTLFTYTDTIKFSLLELHPKNFSSLQFRVIDSTYYLTDRSIPAIFRGAIGNWQAKEIEGAVMPFTSIEPIDANSLIFRTSDSISGADELALISTNTLPRFSIKADLLTKQVDGIFDSDGILSYNKCRKEILYTYYYRNQFVTATEKGIFKAINTTIDTVTIAKFEVAKNQRKREITLGKAPITIQSFAATGGNYLFIKSPRLGKLEPDNMIKQASIIDVYDLTTSTYAFSFYLYDHENEKIHSFTIYGDYLFGLTEHYIVKYRLDKHYFKQL